MRAMLFPNCVLQFEKVILLLFQSLQGVLNTTRLRCHRYQFDAVADIVISSVRIAAATVAMMVMVMGMLLMLVGLMVLLVLVGR